MDFHLQTLKRALSAEPDNSVLMQRYIAALERSLGGIKDDPIWAVRMTLPYEDTDIIATFDDKANAEAYAKACYKEPRNPIGIIYGVEEYQSPSHNPEIG